MSHKPIELGKYLRDMQIKHALSQLVKRNRSPRVAKPSSETEKRQPEKPSV